MPPSFARYATTSGRHEPEGIYLSAPLEGACVVIQGWGAHPTVHAAYTYNGVPLKGHPGVDLAAEPGAAVLAVDNGRVTEISIERGGFGRYLKLEHSWGESFYAHLDDVLVEAGQAVTRGQPLAHVAARMMADGAPAHLHWALRIAPYNRFDGWGGFTDPLPYLVAAEVSTGELGDDGPAAIPPMLTERPGLRRP
jgi:murein DD-endopeptidase MepM/ murein hydrolase activator NlpD